jgi:hypothetical protein
VQKQHETIQHLEQRLAALETLLQDQPRQNIADRK